MGIGAVNLLSDKLPLGAHASATRPVVQAESCTVVAMQMCAAIYKELAEGGRTYITCILMEESSVKIMADAKAAEEEHRRLQ